MRTRQTPRLMPLLGAALILILSGCGMTEKGQGDATPGARSFAVTGFDAVSLDGSDDVEVVTGPAFAVSATGPQAVLDRLNVRVEGTGLKIDRKAESGWNWSGKGAMIRVTLPVIKAAAVAGSGNMRIDRVENPSFSADVTGSGDMSIAGIKVDSLTAGVMGSGDMTLSGSAAQATVSVAGSGTVDADSFTVTNAMVAVKGSGDASLRVTGQASGSVAGSGSVSIMGTSNCAISKAGSGEVSCQP